MFALPLSQGERKQQEEQDDIFHIGIITLNYKLEQKMRVANADAEENPPNSLFNMLSKEQREKMQNSLLQNGQVTKFYFNKLSKIQKIRSMVIALNLFIIIVSSELNFKFSDDYDFFIFVLLIFNLLNALIAVTLSILCSLTHLSLQKQRKLTHQSSTLFSTKKIIWLMLQSIIIFVQPQFFLMDQSFQTQNSFQKTKFLFPINDFLAILSLFKIYIIFRAILLNTSYMSNRSNRLCKMYGCKSDFVFSLKCLFKDNPLVLIFIMFTSSSLIFGYAIYLAQRNLSIGTYEPYVANNFSNALWLILVTITTVGYGDYFPQTILGRLIIFVVAIWGTFIVSIMVVVVSNTLKIEKREKQASIVIKKLQIKNELKEIGGKLIGYSILFRNSKKKGKRKEAQRYEYLCKNYKKEFSKKRIELKLIKNESGLYDQITSNFLNLNNDVDILNQNQDKIINFIHDNLEYKDNFNNIHV